MLEQPSRRVLLGSAAVIGLSAGLTAAAQDIPDPMVLEEDEVDDTDDLLLPEEPADDLYLVPDGEAHQDLVSDQYSLPDRASDWEGVLARFQNKYSRFVPTAGGAPLLEPSIQPGVRSIDSGFLLLEDAGNKLFSKWRTEELLNQSNALLDRCLVTRSERDEMSLKATNISLEIMQYEENDQIIEQEIKDGLFTYSYAQALAEWEGAKAAENGAKWALKHLRAINDKYLGQEPAKDLQNAAQRAAWVSGLPAYLNTERQGYSLQVFPFPQDNLKPPKPERMYVSDHLQRAAFVQTVYSTGIQRGRLSADTATQNGHVQLVTKQRAALGTRAAWEQKQVKIKRRRVEATRKVADYKIRLIGEEGGALNFADKVVDLERIFKRDFSDGIARLVPAAIGLHIIYGYSVVLPNSILSCLPKEQVRDLAEAAPPLYQAGEVIEPSSHGALDDSVEWARNAVAWLLRQRQRERQYVICLSLRRLVVDWRKLDLEHVPFEIDASLFPQEDALRVQAVGLEVLGAVSGYWAVELSAPATRRHRDVNGQIRDIDQGDIVPARLGSVTTASPHERPAMGGISLFNAYPAGRWSIRFLGPSTSSDQISGADDVILHLLVATRAGASAG